MKRIAILGLLCAAGLSSQVATQANSTYQTEQGRKQVAAGLADPAPILHAQMTDSDVARQHAIDGIVTVVDALHGEAALQRHPEARRHRWEIENGTALAGGSGFHPEA